MKPCIVDLVLIAALEQFEYQAIVLEEYGDSNTHTTQEKDVKTLAKMLPPG